MPVEFISVLWSHRRNLSVIRLQCNLQAQGRLLTFNQRGVQVGAGAAREESRWILLGSAMVNLFGSDWLRCVQPSSDMPCISCLAAHSRTGALAPRCQPAVGLGHRWHPSSAARSCNRAPGERSRIPTPYSWERLEISCLGGGGGAVSAFRARGGSAAECGSKAGKGGILNWPGRALPSPAPNVLKW